MSTNPRIVTITAPSAAGKSMVQSQLFSHGRYVPVVSDCTRAPRGGSDSLTRNYISKEEFLDRKVKGLYAQAVELFNTGYAIPKASLLQLCKDGRVPLCDVGIEGTFQLREFASAHNIEIRSIFMFSDPEDLYERHVTKRKTPFDEMLIRLKGAIAEIEEASQNLALFDFVLKNNTEEETVNRVLTFLKTGEGTCDHLDPLAFRKDMERIIAKVESNGSF